MDKSLLSIGIEFYNLLEENPSTRSMKYQVLRLLCLIRDSYTCQQCGYSEAGDQTRKKSKLIVHHRDKSGNLPYPNNNIDNLQTVCSSCHKKAHFGDKYLKDKDKYNDRNMRIIYLRTANPQMKMAEIGRKVNLTRERVRQILKCAGLPTRRQKVVVC